MSPRKYTSDPAWPAPGAAEPSPADTGEKMEQFIWDEAAPSGRVFVLSDDLDAGDDEPEESWRRQLISALQDSDRESAQAKSLRESPPILSAESVRRAPRALTPDRPARASTTAIERQPRHRAGALLLLGVSAIALLSVLLSDTANTPELVASVATDPPIIEGSLITLSGEGELVKPLMFNSPVLVREVLAQADGEKELSPEIRTVRTVSVLFGSHPTTPEEVIAEASSNAPLVAPVPAAQPETASTAPEVAAATPEPVTVPVAREEAEPAVPPADAGAKKAATKATARGPRIATAYEREEPEQKRTARQRPARSQQATAAPRRTTERAPWEANRQGLRTPPPPEESNTVVKLLKTLFPFGSQNSAEAQPKEPASASKTTAPAAKKDSFWWGEQQPTR